MFQNSHIKCIGLYKFHDLSKRLYDPPRFFTNLGNLGLIDQTISKGEAIE
jgi:hypothetical protein